MTLGALLACGVEPADLRSDLARLNLTGWRLDATPTSRNGIGATDVTVAVIELTAGFPVYGVDVEGELVTPTGAALVTTLAKRFGTMPAMRVLASGYGAGKKEFGNRPNLLRVVIGDAVGDEFTGAPEIAV